jgi:hypothetical protein
MGCDGRKGVMFDGFDVVAFRLILKLRETTYMNLLLSMSSIKKNRDGKQ